MWYRIDSQNVLREVSPDWDDFAVKTRASEACGHRVLNRPLWGFISDIGTRSFLNALFFHARQQGASLALTYRCDGPDIRRWFEMVLEPMPGDELVVRHETLNVAHGGSILRIPAPDAACQCTQCLRYHVNEDWIEGALIGPGVDTIIPRRICPECRAAAVEVISLGSKVTALAG